MDLFELLFIAIFIIIPILEGVMKQRRKRSGQGQKPGRDDAPGSEWSDAGERADLGSEDPRSAAEMLPDDLWEVMTGESRSPAGGTEVDTPWSADPREVGASAGPSEDPEPAPSDWRDEPWVVDDESHAEPAESLEYRGPEAYSLETPAPAPLVRRVPTSAERHRRFHELIDQPQRRVRRRRSPLVKALQTADGLKQAVLLKEILGPPKGLE